MYIAEWLPAPAHNGNGQQQVTFPKSVLSRTLFV